MCMHGVVVAFGTNDDGQCEIRDPGYADGVRYIGVACGDDLSFLVCSDGSVRVSGNSWPLTHTMMTPVGYAAVAAGTHHVVLLRRVDHIENAVGLLGPRMATQEYMMRDVVEQLASLESRVGRSTTPRRGGATSRQHSRRVI